MRAVSVPERWLIGASAHRTGADVVRHHGVVRGQHAEEAMLQGLMEVFERYAVKKLYQYELTPPEIPADEFAGTQVLRWLAASGLRYSIRDLSLGKGYPVLGLALWLPGGERALHLGSAASREIALERCLTELYQGNAGAVSRRFHRPGALNGQDGPAAAWAYMAMVTDGSGAFPDRVFDGPPSYPPHDAGAPFATDAQALCAYVDLARERGSAVYVRDYSRLGFRFTGCTCPAHRRRSCTFRCRARSSRHG